MLNRSAVAAIVLAMVIIFAGRASADNSRYLNKNLTFCGEPVALGQAEVYQVVDQNLLLLSEAKSRIWLTLRRSNRYMALVQQELKKASVPADLIYIPMTVTGFAPEFSNVGRGMWRLREAEAKALGLRIDKEIDERLDPVASTAAAAKRLSALKSAYGTWTMAMAAHLIGEPVITRAVTEAGGERNFYKIYLADGQDNLPASVLAGKVLFTDLGSFGYHQASGRGWPPFSGRREKVGQATTTKALAASYGKDYKAFRDANPHILGSTIPAGIFVNIP